MRGHVDPQVGRRVVRAPSIVGWIDGLATHLEQSAPERKALINDYVGEARFGAAVISDHLATLPTGAKVLEVGAGALILSCAVQAAGYRVTAVEPLGVGFSHLDDIRELVAAYAQRDGGASIPELLRQPAEDLERRTEFDFAYSINVMEHVENVEAVLARVWAALEPGAGYRFVCPNYGFPFEPHFGIPTLGGKELTWLVFRKRILGSKTVADPVGTWRSLNWISVRRVRRFCRRHPAVRAEFDQDVLYRFLQRAATDPSFQRRHGTVIRRTAVLMSGLGLTSVARLVPAILQPAMSCWLVKPPV